MMNEIVEQRRRKAQCSKRATVEHEAKLIGEGLKDAKHHHSSEGTSGEAVESYRSRQ